MPNYAGAGKPDLFSGLGGGFSAPSTGNLGLYSGMIGAIGGGVSSYFSAQSQQSSLEFQSDMADINARIAELGAKTELSKGNQEVAQLTLQAGQLKGQQRASMAANGIDLGVGSAAEVQASTEIMKEIDKNTITANAVRSAWGYRVQASNDRSAALMDKASAGAISPIGAGTTSLLDGATKVADSWYNLQKTKTQMR